MAEQACCWLVLNVGLLNPTVFALHHWRVIAAAADTSAATNNKPMKGGENLGTWNCIILAGTALSTCHCSGSSGYIGTLEC
jgi:hypothetical protein